MCSIAWVLFEKASFATLWSHSDGQAWLGSRPIGGAWTCNFGAVQCRPFRSFGVLATLAVIVRGSGASAAAAALESFTIREYLCTAGGALIYGMPRSVEAQRADAIFEL